VVSEDDLKVADEGVRDEGGENEGGLVVEVGWWKLLRKSCSRTGAVRPSPDVTRRPIPKLVTRLIGQ
jgi:hypothetical protein